MATYVHGGAGAAHAGWLQRGRQRKHEGRQPPHCRPRAPDGGIIERDTAVNLATMTSLSLLLHDSISAAARDIATAINKEMGKEVARAVDSRRVDIIGITATVGAVPELMARIGNFAIRASGRESGGQRTHRHCRYGRIGNARGVLDPSWQSCDRNHHPF